MLLTGVNSLDFKIKNELASSTTLDSQHQVIAEWNYNAYTGISEIGCFYNNGTDYVKDANYGAHAYYYSDDITELDTKREIYTPLKSIFEINRPKPGIIHSVYLHGFEKNAINGKPDAANSLSIKDMFNMSANHPRLYPISKDSVFKYWSSGRTLYPYTVGLSKSNKTINYAAPYIEYSEPIYINKVAIKTQYHLGYATSFLIDVKTSTSSSSWTTIYQETSSDLLSDGELEIYYNGTSWSVYSRAIDQPNENAIINFNKNSSETVKIYGLRFIARKMSESQIPLEMIELSPRLVADLTSSTISFDSRSSMSGSAYGLPVGSVISSNGSIKLSNENGYFSKNNLDSILYNILKPNVEFRLYQKLTIDKVNYRFPIKTLYSDIWNDQGDFTVDTQLEDYFKFFKEQAAPDLMIANRNGIPTSAAMLIFMDNVGFNNFRFEKVDDSLYVDKEDVILDYFYSKKEDTVMSVIESLAVSTQTAIYMDVDNELVAMTKEKMIEGQSVKDFWMIGDDGLVSKKSHYSDTENVQVSYITNIESFEESSEPPITDVTVQYNGLGFEKQSMALVGKTGDSVKAMQNTLERSDFGASTINQNLRYTSDIIWQPGNDANLKDNFMAAATLIQDVPLTNPYAYLKKINLLTFKDYNKENIITKLVNSTDDSIRATMCIYLDKSYINTFTNDFDGYVLIDSELIKYYGIAYLVNDPLNKSFFKQIFFSKDEYNSARAKLSQGGSIEPQALIVDLDFTYKELTDDDGKKTFVVVGDGRGQNKTDIAKHKAISTHKDFLIAHPDWHRNGTNLWGSSKSLPKVIINNLTVSDRKETYLQNKTMKFNSFQQSFNGNVRLSGPKCRGIIKLTKPYVDTVNAGIPTSDPSEQIITGIVKTIKNKNDKNVPVRRIGTRMRLISDVPKNVNPGTKTIENGVIGGLAWNIAESSQGSGMTGYFVEIEDVGTIDGKSLSKAKYRNLRLYKIENIGGKLIPNLLQNAWVNVSSTPNNGIDFSIKPSDGKSYSQIFDIEVIIRSDKRKRTYEVYWENQMVINFSEKYSKILTETSKVCLFVRGQSSAIFEYLSVYGSPLGINPSKEDKDINIDYFAGKKNIFSRCYLPTGVTSVIGTDKKGHTLYYEEFGRFVRQVRKYDVRYKQLALKPQLISLSGFNKNYYVADFETSSSGATFWLYNTSNGPINIEDASGTPLWISGFELKQISGGSIQSSKLLEREDYDKALDDVYESNRKLYGKQELQLSGEFINNRAQAEKLARWIATKLKKERKTLNLSIFPNPILKLGDKVGVAYENKYYNGTESYTITSINHSISNTGPSMTIELKECV